MRAVETTPSVRPELPTGRRAANGAGGRVVVIGGGASGVMMAASLLRDAARGLRVSLIEPRSLVGRGIAYSTEEPDHILNTRAGSMSAYADDPEHFWKWLLSSGASDDIRCSDPFCFVPRHRFGAYLGDLLKPWLAASGDGRLQVVQGECVGLRETQGGVFVDLDDGSSHLGHAAVVATGHAVPSFEARGPYVSAWSTPTEVGIEPGDPVLILGTGLSMVDYMVQLANEGHQGPVIALSRRGLLPRVHRRNAPMRIDAADVPFGTDISYLLHWFRDTVRWAEERGGDWRDVVDGLRPQTQALWQSLSLEARRRFLRHARTWWEVHRHRLPPESEVRLRAACSIGNLKIIAGQFLGVKQEGEGFAVDFRRRGMASVERVHVAKVVDCTGILREAPADPHPLVAGLLKSGLARLDPLRIGLDFDGKCALLGRSGEASMRIYGVGPVTRARFWEVTAVPDIRNQCAMLSRRIQEVLGERVEPVNA